MIHHYVIWVSITEFCKLNGRLGVEGKGRIQGNIPSSIGPTTQHCNQLPAEVLGTLLCKPNIFKKRVRKLITEVKGRCGVLEIIYKCREVKKSEVKTSIVKLIQV